MSVNDLSIIVSEIFSASGSLNTCSYITIVNESHEFNRNQSSISRVNTTDLHTAN